MQLKVRVTNCTNSHVAVHFYSSRSEDMTFASLGQLTFSTGEYQLFIAALSLGEGQMQNHLKIIFETEKFGQFYHQDHSNENLSNS